MRWRRRWLGLAALLAAATLGGIAVKQWWADVALAGDAADAGSAASVEGQRSSPARRSAASTVAAAAELAALTTSGSKEDESHIPPEGIEACGARRITADELRRWKADRAVADVQLKEIGDQMQRVGQAGMARIAARLAAGNEHQQVAARLLMNDRDGAALLAERSSDPLAYQMALSACSGGGDEVPNCARLNPRRWAELDPADARPWLRLMAQAQQRKDAVAVDAALAEAAARPRLSRGSFLLEAQAVAVMDSASEVAELGNALAAIIGTDAAIPSFDMSAPLKVCKGEGLRDAVRLERCRTLSRHVLASATDLVEARTAQSLADRAGVPREQQLYDAATLKVAMDRYTARAVADVGMECAAMSRLKQFSTERATLGELAMALALAQAD